MSIQKTTFVSTTVENASTEVYNWMKDNASDLFDTIEKQAGGNLITCSKNGKKVLSLFSGTSNYFTIHNSEEGSPYSSNSVYPTSTAVVNFKCGYKTDYGIVLTAGTSTTVASNKITTVFISKAENGELLACSLNYRQPNNTQQNYPRLVIIAPESETEGTAVVTNGNFEYFNLYMQSETTAFCEAVSPTGKKAPHLFYLPFVQYPLSIGIINDGSKKYVTDGFFALEE